MFNQMDSFRMQFTSHEGGYLYYPSSKSGGKLVTEREYEQLAANWERLTGRNGQWKMAAWTVAAIVGWTLFAQFVDIAEWLNQIAFFGLVAAIVGRISWVSFAPRRLVRERPSVAPPRPIAEVRREVRALLNWPLVLIALLISGTIFFSGLMSIDRTLPWWAWMIGSGTIFLAYIWVGFKKIVDKP